ncbi:MAG: hypothetical protein KIC77_00145 [Clostridiales bacterium]|jgi:hypothetical protein|nr:hypothetical protein [Clostridiales bacterium]
MNKIKMLMRRSKFWKGYFFAIGMFLCFLVIGLIVFSVWLSDYESSQNTVEVDKVLAMFKNKQYSDIIARTDVVMTGFVDEDVYEGKLKEAVEGKTITYVKAFSYDRFANPSYIIKANNEDLCKVTLKKSTKTSKFGFSLYEFDYISEFSFSDINVVFLIPDGAVPYIDGKTVDDVFKKTLAKDQLAKSKYTLTSDSLIINRYEVCGLLAEPTKVEVKNQQGNALALKSNSNNEIVAEPLNITINAPESFTVMVNGVKLTDKYISDQSQENQYIKYMLNEADKSTMSLFNTYKVEQLVERPTVTVQDASGKSIECTYNSKTKTFDVGFKVFTLQIPSNYKVTVNGTDITASENWLTEKNLEITELKNIPENYFTRPYRNVYKIAVLSGELMIEAKNYNGETVSLDYDESSMTYFGNFAVPESVQSPYTQIAIDGAKAYAGFMSNDISMSSFLSRIINGTQMYKDMSEYRQYWYTDHDSTSFENVEAYELRVYGKNCFSCAVYFDYWIYGQRGKPDFQQKLETNTRIWYVNTGEKWYMADIEIFERSK